MALNMKSELDLGFYEEDFFKQAMLSQMQIYLDVSYNKFYMTGTQFCINTDIQLISPTLFSTIKQTM